MRLQEKYQKEIAPALAKEFEKTNVMSIPALKKIVINIGMGEALKDRGQIDKAVADLRAITGQQPRTTAARQANASFKLRKGNIIGLKVTLRGKRMYDFLERLFIIVLPRLRDFQGLNPKSFDGQGNYTMGLEEQIVFPEIDYGKIERVRGLEITMVTSTSSNEESKKLLELLGCPFAK